MTSNTERTGRRSASTWGQSNRNHRPLDRRRRSLRWSSNESAESCEQSESCKQSVQKPTEVSQTGALSHMDPGLQRSAQVKDFGSIPRRPPCSRGRACIDTLCWMGSQCRPSGQCSSVRHATHVPLAGSHLGYAAGQCESAHEPPPSVAGGPALARTGKVRPSLCSRRRLPREATPWAVQVRIVEGRAKSAASWDSFRRVLG